MSVVGRVSMRFSIDGATSDIPDVITTFHAEYTPSGTPDQGDIDDLLAAVETGWWGTAKARWTDDIRLEDLTYAQIDPLPGPVPTVAVVGVDGTIDDAPMTPQDSVVFSWRTATAGKSFRGRSYMPPPARSQVGIDGLLDSGSQGNLADAAVLLVDTVNGAGALNVWRFGVWSRKLELITYVTSVQVGNTVDTMRSRRLQPETYVTRTPA